MISAPDSHAASPRQFRRGFSSLGCGDLPLASIAALAARHGIENLELRVVEGQLDLPAWFNEHGVQASLALLEEANQQVVVLGTSVRLLEGRKGLNELRAFAYLADGLDCPWLRIFDGGTRQQPPRNEAGWEPALELLSEWRQERAASGWRCDILIETHDALARNSDILELVHLQPGGINLLWDSHHTRHIGGEDIRETWAALRPWIRHIHVKDSAPLADGSRPYVLPGSGDFPMRELDALLQRDGFDGVVSLEWERHWHPTLPPLEEALSAWMGKAGSAR